MRYKVCIEFTRIYSDGSEAPMPASLAPWVIVGEERLLNELAAQEHTAAHYAKYHDQRGRYQVVARSAEFDSPPKEK